MIKDKAAIYDLYSSVVSIDGSYGERTPMDVNGNVIPSCLDGVLRSAQRICRDNHGIEHCTIQIEWPRPLHKESKAIQCPPYCDESIHSEPYMSPNGSIISERKKGLK